MSTPLKTRAKIAASASRWPSCSPLAVAVTTALRLLPRRHQPQPRRPPQPKPPRLRRPPPNRPQRPSPHPRVRSSLGRVSGHCHRGQREPGEFRPFGSAPRALVLGAALNHLPPGSSRRRAVRSKQRRQPHRGRSGNPGQPRAGREFRGFHRNYLHHALGSDVRVLATTGDLRPACGNAVGRQRHNPDLMAGQHPPEPSARGHRRRVDRYTNGSFTTVAGVGVPRMSTASSSPISTSGGTNASAMPVSSMGEKLPEVTSPATSPSRSTD